MKKKDRNTEAPLREEELPRADAEEIGADGDEQEAGVDEWREALETAVKQRDDYLDALRRTQADFQNFRRRNQCSRSDGYADGIAEVLTEMIPVIDNLERAIDAAGDEGALLEGVRMTLNQFLEAGRKFGLEEIPAEGQAFDPEIHHAVLREATGDAGRVLEVLQKGYRVKDRILRYAMVKVSVET